MTIPKEWLQSNFPDLSAISHLSTGGQKFVYAATDPGHGQVVLKLIKPSQGLEIVQREIRAVLEVQSPRVPEILDTGRVTTPVGDCFWLIEQRIDGENLRDVLNQGALAEQSVLRLALQVLEALSAAESASIVHRDVKPDNIIRDSNGDFWLLDFGIARHLELTSLTPTAAHFGKYTPGYAPVEQYRNLKRDIDARSDLFALGVTVYESATGANPFRDKVRDFHDVFDRVERLPLQPLVLTTIAAASDFADLVAAMTQKRRDHRPATAAEALDWMRDILQQNNR